jgi:Carboxypeptidase regulatory-like domain
MVMLMKSAVVLFVAIGCCWAQSAVMVPVSGRVLDPQGMTVSGVKVEVADPLGRVQHTTTSDSSGAYMVEVDKGGLYSLVIRSDNFEAAATDIKTINEPITGWDLTFGKLRGADEVLQVTAHIIEPTVDRRDAQIFTKTLFSRDDQIFQTLGAGLNFGQHAGGGKSLEVRRFGFNLDHGGAGGGLRFMRDDIFINDIAGGHAHGYIGSLKGLTPELVSGVDLINGPFNAQYGDFSALGVVTIETQKVLPQRYMARVQYGQWNTRRVVGAYSPEWGANSALLAFEHSYSDGPFQRKLQYGRNNFTAVFSRQLNPTDTFTFRGWGATNKSYSPGQLPVDAIDEGIVSRYGFIDPTEGNGEQAGTAVGYWERNTAKGSKFKANAMVSRGIFDLYSNFTFFLNNPIDGDGIVQHSSRLQQQGNFMYQRPHLIGSAGFGTFTSGANLVANQVNLKVSDRVGRNPTELSSAFHVQITNPGFYGQESFVFLQGKLRLDAGLRYDIYAMSAADGLNPNKSQSLRQGFWEPKAGLAFTPKLSLPFTFHANYGRTYTSVDARSLLTLNIPTLAAATDFYQVGTSHNRGRFSAATSLFLIDRSNEFIFVSDSNLIELGGPTRSSGFEVKSSYQITRAISINGSISKVFNAYYRDTAPREYVIRAPHFTAYSALTISDWHKWSGSLRYRAISHYTLVPEDTLSAPGHNVWDMSVARPINKWLELNFAMDNMLNKSYYETLALYESQLKGQEARERIHATTGYPRTVIGGVTIRLGGR